MGKPAIKRLWGLPLDPDLLRGDDLYPVPEEYSARPDKLIDLRAGLLPYEDEIERQFGWREGKGILNDPDRLKQVSRYLPLEPFWSEFSFDEICKIAFSDVVQSKLSDLFERREYERTARDQDAREMPEHLEFIYKLRNSLHHYSSYPSDWNSLVKGYYAIPDFVFDPDFEVRFDHSSYFNWWSPAFHLREQMREFFNYHRPRLTRFEENEIWNKHQTYLDAVFGYLIYYKGHHVMTIGFSLGKDSILISQIQLKEKRGNRWAFKLPGGYFNYVVTRMYDHFIEYELSVYLVDGQDLAKRIEGLYPKEEIMDSDAYYRIIRTYDQPLIAFDRGESDSRKGSKFYQLIPKTNYLRNPYLPTSFIS
jgi:hypothetical protein